MNNYTKLAEEIATNAHKGQFYGTGDPYVVHATQVAKMAENMGYCDEVIAACYLHDVIEDTDVTATDLLKVLPSSIVDAVISVTFKGSNSAKKIEQSMTNPLGHVVKFCDASDNYANSVIYGPRPGKDYMEYVLKRARYISTLSETLPTIDDIKRFLT